MAQAGSILVLLLLVGGFALTTYLFVGPLLQGRYHKPTDRRREHRHRP
ncbi:MAG: hypothetical protein JW797_09275 [Bradymonadales bacterium]|nr:hypothetical protein [Bradymonadales bacterium]